MSELSNSNIYFKYNDICYSADTSLDSLTTSPPPGAIIVSSINTFYQDCEDCCDSLVQDAPCSCISGLPSSYTLTGNLDLYSPAPSGCSGSPFCSVTNKTITSPGPAGPADCSWGGSDGCEDFYIFLNTSSCRWELSSASFDVIAYKTTGSTPEGVYTSNGCQTLFTAAAVLGQNIQVLP